jgi:hypothetical protein
MGKSIVVFILFKVLSALLRLESKLIVAACRDASVIRGIFRVCTLRYSVHGTFIMAVHTCGSRKQSFSFTL